MDGCDDDSVSGATKIGSRTSPDSELWKPRKTPAIPPPAFPAVHLAPAATRGWLSDLLLRGWFTSARHTALRLQLA